MSVRAVHMGSALHLKLEDDRPRPAKLTAATGWYPPTRETTHHTPTMLPTVARPTAFIRIRIVAG